MSLFCKFLNAHTLFFQSRFTYQSNYNLITRYLSSKLLMSIYQYQTVSLYLLAITHSPLLIALYSTINNSIHTLFIDDPLQLYLQKVENGELQQDSFQEEVLTHLSSLSIEVDGYEPVQPSFFDAVSSITVTSSGYISKGYLGKHERNSSIYLLFSYSRKRRNKNSQKVYIFTEALVSSFILFRFVDIHINLQCLEILF